MMHRPWHSLLFTAGVFAVMAGIGALFPREGLQINGDLVLKFPSAAGLLENENTPGQAAGALEALNRIDTTFRIEGPDESLDTARKPPRDQPLNLKIQYADHGALVRFFNALSSLAETPDLIRVLHYGDSQIEGDRISGYLREKLQSQFGGKGPGFVTFVPLTFSPVNRIYYGEEWDRYTVFTSKDKRVNHSCYGVAGAFTRFMSYRRITDTSTVRTSTVRVVTTPQGGAKAASFDRVRLYYGGARTRVWYEYYEAGALRAADSLERGGSFNIVEVPASSNAPDQVYRFRGLDSPDFYGLSMEGTNGVMVDNFPMRGSSGTFFHLIDKTQLRSFYDHLNVRLIMLQFGGNTLPAIEDSVMAKNYAAYIGNQISIVKKLAPGASILFIGPSDMSVKAGTSYVSYSMLEVMRDELKRTVLGSGCAYFDLYDVMGGRNSMPAWVEEGLAGSDYTHFTPKGARKIGTALYAALINEYNDYLKKHK